ncbi:cadherin repeat domain-containing protein [Fibrobacter sp. UWB12]|uniref:cadherin repeat domain-containing protein n=1 Tax=Fibrobacter sp. UWB12 TaxID=1896203 RepID=UPI000913621E|nr:cadherin repeat domain-containing protein [Fibrobacter sp. UWB12]SHK36499.1 Cadherin domain-containing protein [Fibrobacter sp. UWB12]
MWFSKLSLKAAALVLTGVVSSMAQSGVAPLTFGDPKTDVNNWNYLTQYKLWGTNGIELGNRPGFYDPKYFDKSTMSYPADIDLLTLGAVGTVKNLSSVGDGGWLDGPIVVGGSITNSGQNFEILTGPVRVGGSNGAIVRNGVQTCSMTASTGPCDPSIIPDYRSNIKVPTLSGVTWGGSLSVGNNSNKRTLLDVSSACSGGTCDLYYSSIDFQNDSRLAISIPEKQIARIFTKSLNLKTHPEIVVRDPVAGKDLAPSEYKGNLVIYVDGDITFENIDNVQIMGTLVSNGTLTMKCNMIISGQFIANKIVIGNEIDAKNFTFTPVHPTPKLVVDNNSKKLKESTSWYTLDIVLDGESEKEVTFDYCFEFQSATGVEGKYAGYQDVAEADADHDFPICGKKVGKGKIPAGETKAKGIYFKPLIDGLVENDEALWFQVNNIEGAELSSDYENGLGYKIYIVSNDEFPTVKTALKFDVNEDEKHTFTKAEFQFQHATQNFASVIITSLPNKGSLVLNGTKLTSAGSGITVAVADLGKLTYQAAANEFGNNYTTFKYKVVGDGAAGGNTSTEYTATVNVIPVNDKPTVADAAFTVNELDHAVAGGPIVITDVSNERNVDTYTYKLVPDKGDYATFNNLFEISKLSNNQNATIKVKSGAVINYSQKNKYVVYATVTDDAATETKAVNGPLTSAQFKITVTIKNENDPPTIGNQTFTKPEKQSNGKIWPAGTSVGKVTTASDPDGDPLTYSIITTGVPFKFNNGSNELVITDGSVLDYETTPTYTLKVLVSDGELTATATITVKITDVNEGPENLVLVNEYSVDENTATGKTVGTFTVFDPDAGDALTYTLTGALTGAVDATTATKNLSAIFVLKEAKNANGTRTVNINVKDGALLDYEKLFIKNKGNATYQATVTVKDAAGLSVSKTTNIAVKDVNEKVSAKGGTFYLNEHSPIGSPVCAVQYKDDENNPLDCSKVARVEGSDLDIYADDDVYSNNDSFNNLTYQIIPGKNTGTDYKKFTVNKNTGALSTNDEFDYESGSHQYTFVVTVSDGTFTADAEVIVNIDNIEEPKLSTEYEGDVTVEENTGEGETVVDFVEILEKIKAENDEIREKLEKIVGKVSFKIDQEASANANGIFAITTTAGKAIVKVKDPTKLDFEALYSKDKTKDKTTYKVVVVASGEDANGFDVEALITMGITVTDVNEKPEITTAAPLTVPESFTIDDGEFGKVTATDQDNAYGSVHPAGFNKLTYKVDEVLEVNGSTDFPFELNPNTGVFTVADGQKLDYTKQKQYKCIVKVVDNPKLFDDEGKLIYPALSATKTIVINVTDVNRPSEFKVLTNPYEVEENVDKGTALQGKQIVVYDEDDIDLDELQITITDNNATATRDAAKLFEVVQVGKTDQTTHLSTFVIKTKAGINYEDLYDKTASEAAFDITLTIVDTEVRTKYPEQDTRIQIIDVNEEPAFTKPAYDFEVAENVAKEAIVGTAEATDPDIYNARFGTLYFSLEGDEAAPFDINGSTGEISVSKSAKLDYELKNIYEFYAVVTDKKFKKKVPVTVKVTNVKETPEFPDVPELAVDENSATGTKVDVVTANDDDCKNSNTCKKPTYSLEATDVAADDYKSFSIDKTTGTIKVNGDLNYEKKDEYSVRVVATDGDDPTLTSYVDVTIKINDVNDKPTYAESEYVFEVHENAPIGEFIGSVVADDEDTWSKLTYAIVDYVEDSKDAAAFKIDDGKIYLNTSSLNFEKKKQYQIVAKATDNGKSYGASIGRTDFVNYTATTLVTINLIDDPDGPEIVDDGKKSYDVEENTVDNNTPNGKEIKCYLVKDEDKGQLATLVAYVTDVGNTDADRIFDAKMKSDSLCLIVKDASKLNYETNKHVHKITVEVMDTDNLTAKVEKTINIIDVNEMPMISGNKVFSLYENKGEGYVVGKLYPDDIDTSKAFIDNVFSAVGGDTDLFTITEDGKIKAKRDFDYEKETIRTFELDVALSDRNKTKYPKLTTKTTITINLKDEPEVPEITTKEFSVYENSPADSLIGVIKATDPDGDSEFLFSLTEESPYVTVKPNGEIHVKEGANIDYEKMQKFTIKVTVKDVDGLEFSDDIVIKVIDVNEPPKITPQEFTFPEDSKPGTKKGPIEAKDPDTKNPKFNDLKFYPVDENEKFEIKTNGDVVLKGDLDYESEKSYVIKVYVTDGEFKDTTDITIKVGNVVEKSVVEITRVEAGDSVYIKPPKDKPIYTNQPVITVEWTQDGKTKSSLDSLKEGCQYIIKKYKAPDKDVEGADTIEVCYSTAAPIVDIDADKIKVIAENIYTIVENVDKKDSSVYVNNKTKDVEVSVIDTAYKDAGSKYKDKFKVTVVLDTVAVSDKTVKEMVEISKSEITLEKNPKSDVKTKPIGDKTKVSYNKVINGDSVTVSYYTDDKGEIIKTTVIDENGEKKNIDVIEVSKVVDVKGQSVTVSYKADAETGKILYGDSEGNLLVNIPKSSSSSSDKDEDAVDLKTGVGAFTVTYDAKGKDGNKTTVSYAIDEKGKIPSNEEGDRGYLVTYTYTNKYGNSADKSVFMVLDKRAPIVKILTPADGDVVYANYVDVDWCIAVDGDEKNCVKQDTLKFQSLNKGVNRIKRIYRDKAGNETIAEIQVMMKKAKDVNINLEEPMVIVSIDSVRKYYDNNPPEENQKYAVSILNPTTQTEKEVIKGFKKDTKKGSGEEPYPGYEGHIGPTVTVDMKVPLVSAVGGLATLDDIIINGNMIPLDGVDADNSEKATVEEYVEKYCSAEFKKDLGKDYSKALLYSTTARVTLWFYTTGGQFVDKYRFDYDIEDPEMVDKAGLVKFFFEMKPDINGELRDKNGRLYGTGPYIVKTKVDIRSTQRCVVPPVDKSKVGDVLKSSDEMLKRFGYRRPVLRGNEKSSESSKKEDKKEDKKDDKKKSNEKKK